MKRIVFRNILDKQQRITLKVNENAAMEDQKAKNVVLQTCVKMEDVWLQHVNRRIENALQMHKTKLKNVAAL